MPASCNPATVCIPPPRARGLCSTVTRTVIDGPFPHTNELVAGFWIWTVKDMDEAVAWVKRCPNPLLERSEIEIRPMFEMEDFGYAVTPEIAAHVEELRARVAKQ